MKIQLLSKSLQINLLILIAIVYWRPDSSCDKCNNEMQSCIDRVDSDKIYGDELYKAQYFCEYNLAKCEAFEYCEYPAGEQETLGEEE